MKPGSVGHKATYLANAAFQNTSFDAQRKDDRLKVPTENPVSAPHVEPLGIFIHVPPDRPTLNFLISTRDQGGLTSSAASHPFSKDVAPQLP
ncbi:MAG: hypothetical protein AUH15_04490 [Acidobacteriales bacterium 13_2_20CM_55_8]|nr:MAG: hypothetical protein AUH15_04490 [Acidobacteriales bacterium 13_2_20CM_55_8]